MLTATLLCLAALCQVGPGDPGTLQGTVIETGTGRPLAGVSVRFSDEADARSAVTDEQGRFAGLTAKQAKAVPVDGEQGPAALVRAEDDRAWPWDLIPSEALSRQPDYARKLAVESLHERVDTRWRLVGGGPSLLVECPPVGDVEVVVPGPDGVPLEDRPVLVVPKSDNHFGVIRFSGRTDRSGRFRLRCYEGSYQIEVRVPGIGFGSTGRVEVAAGKVARPPIPRLSRFARVEGRVAPALVAAGTRVELAADHSSDTVRSEALCDDQGRFTLVDVVPGAYRVVVWRGGQNVPTAYRSVRPEPGRVLGGVVVEPAPPTGAEERKRTERMLRQLNGDRDRTVTWVEGTIRDEKGQPLPGALVYLRFEYHGGLRLYEEVRSAKADDRGRYQFEGPLHPSMGTLTIVTSARRRPPAIAYAPGPDATLDPGDLKPAQLDVAVGSAGASARVTVLQDGRPLSGATVRLPAELGVALSDAFYVGSARGVERNQIENLLEPKATSGPDGVARFENLLPGEFGLIAIASANPDQLRRARSTFAPSVPFAIAEGIAAPPGGTAQTTVAVHRPSTTVRFRVLKPDDAPVVGQDVELGFGQNGGTMWTSLTLDDQGIGSHEFDRSGLWSVELRFRDTKLKSYPVNEEPYYRAEAMIPVSPGLALDEPLTLRAVRRDLGSIRARLLDGEGRPARGTVMIVEALGMVRHAGTVDAEGSVRFTDLPSGKYRLRGAVDGQAPAPRPLPGAARLDDDELQGHSTVFDRELELDAGAEATVDLRLEPVGYVRAKLRPPAGRSPSDYTGALKFGGPDALVPVIEADREDETILLGPAPAGRWPLALWEKVEPPPYLARGERTVVVEPGRVVRVELEPDAGPERPKGPNWRPSGFRVTVFLPDGVTPAFGARAFFFHAGESEPTAAGIADASGRLTWAGRWRSQPEDNEQQPAPLKEPTIAAWMPGVAGPAVAVIGASKSPRLVLPSSGAVSGRVTLGGRGVAGRNSRFEVVAAPEGRDALAVALSCEATADPEGRFRFPGMAPGRYVLQASRDDIWLSRSIPFVVEPGKDVGPIDLDIPEPGGAVSLELVDERGRPARDLSFAIRRPEGPLAARLTMRLRTDDRGSAIVRGLEAGPHSLVARGDDRPRSFTVPVSRPESPPRSIQLQVGLPPP